MLALSVLDQSPIRADGTARQALAETVELSRVCERLGYRRYWLAEHHATDGFAGTAPEVLVAHVAAATSTIRVGSGGVMLSHYSPLKVAEQFRLLETLHPGRIDLGIGRAPGADPRTTLALAPGAALPDVDRFPQQLADLVGYLGDGLSPGHPFAGVRAMPDPGSAPELWLLGSSDQSAVYAAALGCPFSYAHFINDRGGAEVMRAYRDHFRPSRWANAPTGSAGVFVICADSETEAQRLAASRDLWRLRLDRGELGTIPTIEEAEAHPYSEIERRRIAAHRQRMVIGAPEQAKAKLEALAEAYGVAELVIVTITYDFAARRRSYELLAEAFALSARSDGPEKHHGVRG